MSLLGKQVLSLMGSKNIKHNFILRSDVNGKTLHSFNVSFVQKLISARLILSYKIKSVCHRQNVTNVKHGLFQKNGLPESLQNSNYYIRTFSTKCNLVADIMKDLHVDELRVNKSDRKKKIQTAMLVKETLAKKCDEALANLNDEEVKKLKVIQLEHDFLFSEGHYIPSPKEMTSENWLEAMALPSATQRLKYYIFVMKRLNLRKKVKSKSAETKEPQLRKPPYEHGRIFMRIYETTMKRWLQYGLVNAMQFGLPLVIDMDYVSYMRAQEVRNTVEQLLMVYNMNREDSQLPFHLHFTSCQEDHVMYKMLQIAMQDNEHFLATVTEKSYLDIFDQSQLVYLSPNAEQVMKEFDPDAVYIIGAFNDKVSQEPVSQARAKKQGIKSLRLPIDEHVQWNLGSKCITLDQVLRLMAYVKNGVPWKEAILNSVPKRKIRN